ncbi:MAG: TetR-like C-terminal domain-containing protein [Acutalibacteraceae bacterium]
MYHIKQDKRSQLSSEMMYKALRSLLKEKTIDQISITELVNTAEVGRSTFYRNFDEITDILLWQCDLHFRKVIRDYIAYGDKNGLGLLEYVLSYWEKNSEIIEILFSVNRIDIIYDRFVKNSAEITGQMKELINIPEEEYDYFVAIRIFIFIGVIKTWIDNGKKEGAKQLSLIVGKQVLSVVKSGLML